MLFAVCHPCIALEAQVGLALRMLCGFGIAEIATAFLTNKETINKRLFRAKEKLRTEKVVLTLPEAAEISARLEAVLTTLYLLFNEGYYSESQDVVLREDLCLEAMRLTHLLIEHEQTNLPAVNALLSLMCFHASRFQARKGKDGAMILYDDQDETLWDQGLITKGAYFLHQASVGDHLSRYHLEATIAYWNTQKADTREKWETILQLYNRLLQLNYSPIAALNRTYALAKTNGSEAGIAAAEQLNMTSNHFYFVLLGELYFEIDPTKANEHFQKALGLARTSGDRHTIEGKIARLKDF
jgi:RNA polymerase sigma-70 factor (ECF subfamily)